MCVAAALISGGSFAPVCAAIGVAWGVKTWNDSAEERQFWVGCAMLRQYAQAPEMPCVYTPSHQAVAHGPRQEVLVQVLEDPEY